MFCPQCGKELDDSMKFCDQCGSPLASAQTADVQTAQSEQTAQPVNTIPEMVQPTATATAVTEAPAAETAQNVFTENTIPTMAMPSADTTSATTATATATAVTAAESESTANVLPQMAVAQKPEKYEF